jgi:hypothetical protein
MQSIFPPPARPSGVHTPPPKTPGRLGSPRPVKASSLKRVKVTSPKRLGSPRRVKIVSPLRDIAAFQAVKTPKKGLGPPRRVQVTEKTQREIPAGKTPKKGLGPPRRVPVAEKTQREIPAGKTPKKGLGPPRRVPVVAKTPLAVKTPAVKTQRVKKTPKTTNPASASTGAPLRSKKNASPLRNIKITIPIPGRGNMRFEYNGPSCLVKDTFFSKD